MKKSKSLIGKVLFGKYEIIKLLGSGGMDSEVYVAKNLKYNANDYFDEKFKYAAVKIIYKTPETTLDHWNRILDEGVTNARLSKNDYIVRLFDFHQPNSTTIILIMEYLDGPSLKTLIRERGCISVPEALSIFKKIVLGVCYMHSRERVIIHRDLKPENILMSKDLLDVKIADFGISSVVDQSSGYDNVLTYETTFFGTIAYVSPDAVKVVNKDGKNKMPLVTKQFDFHSLGIILYEMLIGEKPFEINDENDPKIISYFSTFDITPMKKINPKIRNEIENIFIRLTASKEKDFHLRYTDSQEILDDINNAEEAISLNKKEEKSLKPESKRVYQNIVPLKEKNNAFFVKVLMKKPFVLFYTIILILLVLLVIIFGPVGYTW